MTELETETLSPETNPAPVETDGTTGDIAFPGLDAAPIETVEVIATPEPRLLLTTPFETYTVTEGLLLFVLLALCAGFLWDMIKEAF